MNNRRNFIKVLFASMAGAFVALRDPSTAEAATPKPLTLYRHPVLWDEGSSKELTAFISELGVASKLGKDSGVMVRFNFKRQFVPGTTDTPKYTEVFVGWLFRTKSGKFALSSNFLVKGGAPLL